MIDKILSFQMSFFGDYDFIKPDPNVIFELMSIFKEREQQFIPNTISITQIDALTNTTSTVERLKMTSVDKRWELIFLPDRIDANFTNHDYNYIDHNYNTLFNMGKTFLTIILNNFTLKAKRISSSGQLMMKKLSIVEVDDYRKNFLNTLDYFSKKTLQEWTVSYNVLGECYFEKIGVENINVINNLALIKSQNQEDPFRVVFSFDINTLPENTANRFGESEISLFKEKAENIVDILLKEIDGDDDGKTR